MAGAERAAPAGDGDGQGARGCAGDGDGEPGAQAFWGPKPGKQTGTRAVDDLRDMRQPLPAYPPVGGVSGPPGFNTGRAPRSMMEFTGILPAYLPAGPWPMLPNPEGGDDEGKGDGDPNGKGGGEGNTNGDNGEKTQQQRQEEYTRNCEEATGAPEGSMETRGSSQDWYNRVNGAIRRRNDSRYDEADEAAKTPIEKFMDWLASDIRDDNGEPDDPADSFLDVFFFNTGLGKKVNDFIARHIDRKWRARINNALARHGNAMAVIGGIGAAAVAFALALGVAGAIVGMTGGAVAGEAAAAAEWGEYINSRYVMNELETIFQTRGLRGILKTIRSLSKNVLEHLDLVEGYEYKSSVYTEINNWSNYILDAIKFAIEKGIVDPMDWIL